MPGRFAGPRASVLGGPSHETFASHPQRHQRGVGSCRTGRVRTTHRWLRSPKATAAWPWPDCFFTPASLRLLTSHGSLDKGWSNTCSDLLLAQPDPITVRFEAMTSTIGRRPDHCCRRAPRYEGGMDLGKPDGGTPGTFAAAVARDGSGRRSAPWHQLSSATGSATPDNKPKASP